MAEFELTDEQIAKLKQVFDLFDKDGDGTITIHELGTVMREMDEYPTQAELQAIIDEIDADGNQIIEFPEFVDLMARRRWGERQNGNEDELRAAFSHFDPDSQGQVSLAELRHAMTNIGEKLKDEEIDEMFQFMVKDGEGKASLDDFIKVMMDPLGKPID